MIEFKVAERGQLHSAILNAPIEYCKDGYMVTITPIDGSKKPKTDAQRNSFHLWCGLLAEELNAAGLDQRVVLAAMKEGFVNTLAKSSQLKRIYGSLSRLLLSERLSQKIWR